MKIIKERLSSLHLREMPRKEDLETARMRMQPDGSYPDLDSGIHEEVFLPSFPHMIRVCALAIAWSYAEGPWRGWNKVGSVAFVKKSELLLPPRKSIWLHAGFRASLALLAAALISSAAFADDAPVGRDSLKLRWAPPVLSNPKVIELGTGTTYTKLADDQDCVIKLPKTKKTGSTIIEGGRNITIVGGYITLPETPDRSNKAISRAIYIKNNHGTVHIEGLLIDVSGGGMSDGIAISSPDSIVQIENVRVDGVFGFYHEFHADVVQAFGGVKELRIDKLTGYSAYQGLMIAIDLGPIGRADISRVNLVCIGEQIWGPKNNGGYLIWLTPGAERCTPNYPVIFTEVYALPRSGRTLGDSVWPPTGGKTPCPASVAGDDSVVTFPGLPVTGCVKKGLPPTGDFVLAKDVGLEYAPPGYLTTK
jgi:hypothetical protein